MDADGYPTLEELQKVGEWPYDDPHGLLDYVHSLWHFADWGWTEYEGKDDDDKTRVVMCSTGGWSGNEDVMHHLRSNFLAYHQMFVAYRRGGHYHLELPARKP